jgi:hypothetical protein
MLTEDNLGTMMFLFGMALLLTVLLRRWASRSRQQKPLRRPNRNVAESTSEPSSLIDAPADVLRWQVEMHETARELKAELDSKMSALQTLVLLARKECERLEDLLARADGCRGPLRVIGAAEDIGVNNAPHAPVLPCDERQRRDIYNLADEGATAPEIAGQIGVPVGEVEFLLGLRGSS